ncbi:outer membrane lipoprotein LolB [Ottowia sp.]|uniref:outer membrane lipoprotein LolB n=1 Tax=Ottowia sp. TaxID=1898956 RepID=UPI002CB5466A|nr:outer membrane lipoprotein LolB [Ottowia sp.]HOB67206.1 outer membrane lipoprotein LolB [Ottowia sp.]HPZ56781.1 outer membrane lipoprotein LolB [Ottowia sp.]HQD47954.1 outer membrane lipoprotein LolB [Ottowia sp.]
MTAPLPRAGRRTAAWRLGLLIATLFIAGCVVPPRAGTGVDAESDRWSGRLALRVESEPPQSFAAAFALSGNPQAGELTLTSPIGSTIAVMQWQPGEALLRQGDQTRRYASLDALAQEATGTPLPVRALFGWLRGEPQSVPGWQADLSRLPDGRLSARRLMPLPTADLRVVLDR